jgi:hypothetical protein
MWTWPWRVWSPPVSLLPRIEPAGGRARLGESERDALKGRCWRLDVEPGGHLGAGGAHCDMPVRAVLENIKAGRGPRGASARRIPGTADGDARAAVHSPAPITGSTCCTSCWNPSTPALTSARVARGATRPPDRHQHVTVRTRVARSGTREAAGRDRGHSEPEPSAEAARPVRTGPWASAPGKPQVRTQTAVSGHTGTNTPSHRRRGL